MSEGPRILRVAGPLVEVEGFDGAAMNDLIALGQHASPAEIIAIRGDRLTLQAYEYTGGLGPGDATEPLRQPLSARLGPDLIEQAGARSTRACATLKPALRVPFHNAAGTSTRAIADTTMSVKA